MQACPDTEENPKTRDRLIYVGGCGTAEKIYGFDRCPGYYLRTPHDYPGRCVAVGDSTPFELAALAHWRFTSGHSLGDPPPPKLTESVEIYERACRTRTALQIQAQKEYNRREELKAKHPGAKTIATNRPH